MLGFYLIMRTHRIFFLSTMAGLFACNSSPLAADCQQFRTGTFLFHVRMPLENYSFLIRRQDNFQTETNLKTGAVSKLAIKWTSDCTYELRLLESTEHFSREVERFRREAALKTAIIHTTPTYYVFRTERDGADFVLTDTLWVKK